MKNYKYEAAVKLINSENKPTEDHLRQKASAYFSLGKNKDAILIYKKLWNDHPLEKEYGIALIRSYQAEEKWVAADSCYSRLLFSDPENSYFLLGKAQMNFNSGRFKNALNLYKNLYSKGYGPQVFNNMGKCFEKMNQADSALFYYTKAIKNDPLNVSATANIINLQIEKEKYSEAAKTADNYSLKDSSDTYINKLRAFSYYELTNYKKSSVLFQKCFDRGDSSLFVNQYLGLSYYWLNDPRAFVYLSETYQDDPFNTLILYGLATVCHENGNYALSVKYFTKLLQLLKPKTETLYIASKNIASDNFILKNYNESIRYYEISTEYGTDTEKATAYRNIAEVYDFNLKNTQRSIIYYKKYLDILTQLAENSGTDIKKGKEQEEQKFKVDYYSPVFIYSEIQRINKYLDYLGHKTH